MKHRLRFAVVLIVGISLLAACTGPSRNAAAVATGQDSAGTDPGSEAHTPLVELLSETECFTGPDIAYDVAGVLAAGGFYRVLGINGSLSQIDDEVTWLKLDPGTRLAAGPGGSLPDELSPQPDPPGSATSLRCWVPLASINLTGDLQSMPVVEMPFIRMLGPADCVPGAEPFSGGAQPLESGGLFRVISIGNAVVQIDDEVTWSGIENDPSWIQIDDEVTWLRIDPIALGDPDPPMLPSGDMQLRCWVPSGQVEIRGDLNQVPTIPGPAVLIGTGRSLGVQEASPVEVEAVCDRAMGDQPALQVSRSPVSSTSPSITVDGETFDGICHAPEPGVLLCVPFLGEPGSTHTIRTCYPDELCELWTATVPACPEPSVSEVVPVCDAAFEGRPAVRISGPPASLGEVWAAVDGEPVDFCHAPDSGVKQCLPLEGEVGSWVVVTTCRTGEGCQSWPITVPDCTPEPELRYEITATCFLSPTRYQAAIITYEGTDARLALARANGTDLICSGSAGRYSCHGIPGDPGSEVNLTFCLTYGGCFSGRFTASDCGAGSSTPSIWRIVSAGCHDRERIYFILDTGESWLVPGVEYEYTAYDGTTWYSCEVNPTIPGRLYCSGTQPGSPGQLQVCVQQGSAPRSCNTFTNWRTTAAAIGSCAPTREPSEIDPCAQWDYGTCQNMSACEWDSAHGICTTK